MLPPVELNRNKELGAVQLSGLADMEGNSLGSKREHPKRRIDFDTRSQYDNLEGDIQGQVELSMSDVGGPGSVTGSTRGVMNSPVIGAALTMPHVTYRGSSTSPRTYQDRFFSEPSSPRTRHDQAIPGPLGHETLQDGARSGPSSPRTYQDRAIPGLSSPRTHWDRSSPAPSSPRRHYERSSPAPSSPRTLYDRSSPAPSSPRTHYERSSPGPSSPRTHWGISSPAPLSPRAVRERSSPGPASPGMQFDRSSPGPSNPGALHDISSSGSSSPRTLHRRSSPGTSSPRTQFDRSSLGYVQPGSPRALRNDNLALATSGSHSSTSPRANTSFNFSQMPSTVHNNPLHSGPAAVDWAPSFIYPDLLGCRTDSLSDPSLNDPGVGRQNSLNDPVVPNSPSQGPQYLYISSNCRVSQSTNSSRPGHSVPDSSHPGHFTPDCSRPGHSVPDSSHPGYFTPDSSHPHDPGHFTPDNSCPGHFTSDSSRPGYFTPDSSHPGHFTPDNSNLDRFTSSPRSNRRHHRPVSSDIIADHLSRDSLDQSRSPHGHNTNSNIHKHASHSKESSDALSNTPSSKSNSVFVTPV